MTRKDAHPLPRQPRATPRAHARALPRAFTLIELLVVIAIIGILTAITVPAIKSLSKSNDTSQATNVVRSLISNARSIAISQHRMAGIVFFDESSTFSSPVNGSQTAMQLFVEAYDQSGAAPGVTNFVYYSTQRQYLPSGIRIAMLNETGGISAAENADPAQQTRAILFDAEGNLSLRDRMATFTPSGTPGTYPQAYGDWKFGNSGVANASSSPGFFLYSGEELKAQFFTPDAAGDASRTAWLRKNSSVIIVNANTGGVLR